MPTKALVASAYAAHLTRRGADFGVVVPGEVTFDPKALKTRQRKVADTARGNVER
jgi:pyruvate/2-oxoglutarate dehydrogenase complex dihydrolipoamide dehydrogenase (E3) component